MCCQFSLLIGTLFISQFVHAVEIEVDGGLRILASCEHHIIRVHENLMQHSINYISICEIFNGYLAHRIMDSSPWILK